MIYPVVTSHQRFDVSAHGFLQSVAENARRRRIEGHDRSFIVDRHDGVGDSGQNCVHAHFAFDQGFPCALVFAREAITFRQGLPNGTDHENVRVNPTNSQES